MKIYGAIRTVIYWALAALVIVYISTLAEIEVLRYFIGGVMIFYGVEEIVLTVVKSKKHYSLNLLYRNLIEILIGFTLIVFVETGDVEVTYAVVCVCWAIWSILREARELVEVTEELQEHKPILSKIASIVNMLESLTVIALSLTMLIEPGEHHAKIHLYLLAVELFTKVLFPIVHYVAECLTEKKTPAEQTVADAPSERAESAVAASCEEQQNTDKPTETKSSATTTACEEQPNTEVPEEVK